MITRKAFIKIVTTLDDFYNKNVNQAFELLGISECVFYEQMDSIFDALVIEVDPKDYALEDNYTVNSGSYLGEWLFNTESTLRSDYSTPGLLYDYIVGKYDK